MTSLSAMFGEITRREFRFPRHGPLPTTEIADFDPVLLHHPDVPVTSFAVNARDDLVDVAAASVVACATLGDPLARRSSANQDFTSNYKRLRRLQISRDGHSAMRHERTRQSIVETRWSRVGRGVDCNGLMHRRPACRRAPGCRELVTIVGVMVKPGRIGLAPQSIVPIGRAVAVAHPQ